MENNLYKFLLADDEHIVRNGFSEKINWEEQGFEFLPPCTNGKQAIESIQKYNPDIVLTDICMPQIDGLEVSEYILKNYPDTIVVILSGYDDFEYAQTALRNKVFDYVLKPISSKTLKKLLKKLKQTLDGKKSFKQNLENLEKQVEESKSVIRERFFNRLIQGYLSQNELERYYDYINFPKSAGSFSILIVDPDNKRALLEKANIQIELFLMAVKNQIENIIKQKNNFLLFQTNNQQIIIILAGKDKEGISELSRTIPEKIIKEAFYIPGSTVSVGIGGDCSNLKDIHISFKQALKSLEYRFIQGNNSILTLDENRAVSQKLSFRLEQYLQEIQVIIKYNSEEKINIVIDNFFDALRNELVPLYIIKLEINKFLIAILQTLHSIGINYDNLEIEESSDPFNIVSSLTTIDEIHHWFIDMGKIIYLKMKEKRQNFAEKKVFKIQNYLEENYWDSELSIEKICSIFYLSSSYLSRIFKKYTNKTLVEYLTSIRMARACELIKTSNKKTYEIAELTGFNEPGYFNVIFKKTMNMTPSEYRNSL